jgi:hypothetical protein
MQDLLHVPDYSILRERVSHIYRRIHSFEWIKNVSHLSTDADKKSSSTYWHFSEDTEAVLSNLGFLNYSEPKYIYSGYDRGMDKKRALECAVSHSLLFVGDSRMLYQRMHINRYLGGDYVKFLYLNLDPYSTGPDGNMYFGLASFFKFGLDSIVFEHLLGGGTVLINSILHDLIDFGERQLTQQIRQIYGIRSCGTCIGNTSHCKCQSKQNAIQLFEANIRKLSLMVQSCPQSCGRLIWVLSASNPQRKAGKLVW